MIRNLFASINWPLTIFIGVVILGINMIIQWDKTGSVTGGITLKNVFGKTTTAILERSDRVGAKTEYTVFRHNWQSDADCTDLEAFCAQFLPTGSSQEIFNTGKQNCFWNVGAVSKQFTPDGKTWTSKPSARTGGVRMTSTSKKKIKDRANRYTDVAGSWVYWIQVPKGLKVDCKNAYIEAIRQTTGQGGGTFGSIRADAKIPIHRKDFDYIDVRG